MNQWDQLISGFGLDQLFGYLPARLWIIEKRLTDGATKAP
jgi:hypothetical protein